MFPYNKKQFEIHNINISTWESNQLIEEIENIIAKLKKNQAILLVGSAESLLQPWVFTDDNDDYGN